MKEMTNGVVDMALLECHKIHRMTWCLTPLLPRYLLSKRMRTKNILRLLTACL